MMRSFLQEMLREEQGQPGRPVYGYPNLDDLMEGAQVQPRDAGTPVQPLPTPQPQPARPAPAPPAKMGTMELVP